MEKVLAELKNTPGTNDKLAILERIRDDKDILRCFQLTYDPFTMFYINKLEVIKTGAHALNFRQTVNEFYDVCRKLSTREVTGNEARMLVELFLSKCAGETQEVYIKILKKDLKVGVTDTLMNKVYGDDFIETFDVQLANKYLEKMNSKDVKNAPFFWASPKLDGLRCFYKKGHLLTRNGHEILGFDHIIRELEKADAEFFDGELYSDTIDFQEIQGAVMSNKNIDPERKNQIYYNVFAMGRKSFKNTTDMVEALREVSTRSNFKGQFVKFVPYQKVNNNLNDITALCAVFMNMGYEGVMLRHPEKWYEWKRSNALMKFKLFREEDFKVVGFYEGQKGTKLEGQLGGIIVEGPVAIEEGGTKKSTIRSECGSGFKEKNGERLEIWKNQNKYLGKTAEIKFQGLTDDNSSLRFPIFLKWKEDR
jgi:DNA ligase 1